jgi:thioredoxin 2
VIAKVDTEALPEIAGRFGIRGISTLVLFQAGRETKRTSGAMPAAVIAQTFGLD